MYAVHSGLSLCLIRVSAWRLTRVKTELIVSSLPISIIRPRPVLKKTYIYTLLRPRPLNTEKTIAWEKKHRLLTDEEMSVLVYYIVVCPFHYHGRNCNITCSSHCQFNSSMTGSRCFRNRTCVSGCQSGWTTDNCNAGMNYTLQDCIRPVTLEIFLSWAHSMGP